jgi:hypothetical protein
MYGLFKRVERGAELLRSMMGAHVEQAGRKIVHDADKVGVGFEGWLQLVHG